MRTEGLSGSVGVGESSETGDKLREMLTGLAEGLAVGSGSLAPWFLQVVKCC